MLIITVNQIQVMLQADRSGHLQTVQCLNLAISRKSNAADIPRCLKIVCTDAIS